MKWDVFISYASEDKEPFVDSLARELQKKGLEVWYDEFILKVGDSLRKSIDNGLANSRYGIVVLSRDFFKKNWPQRELDGLVAGEKVILPVLLGIEIEDVMEYSLTLADKVSVKASKGTQEVLRRILEVVQPDLAEILPVKGVIEYGPKTLKDVYEGKTNPEETKAILESINKRGDVYPPLTGTQSIDENL